MGCCSFGLFDIFSLMVPVAAVELEPWENEVSVRPLCHHSPWRKHKHNRSSPPPTPTQIVWVKIVFYRLRLEKRLYSIIILMIKKTRVSKAMTARCRVYKNFLFLRTDKLDRSSQKSLLSLT